MRERKYWIDYLKAIAIYLVILGHLPDELHIKWGIYLFHMPLFFIISGYLYKPRKVKDEIKKVITQLFLPYMFYGLGLIGLYCFMRNTFNISLLEGFLIGDYLKVCEIHPAMCPIWFVLVLINIRIILLLLNKVNLLLLLSISFIAGSIAVKLVNIQNILMFKTTLLCLPFFLFGHFISKNNLTNKLLKMRTEFISLLIIPLLIAFYAGHKNGNVAIIFCLYGYNIIIFYTVAITISFILMVITQKVCTKSIKLIELISEGTFLVMSVHYMMLNTVMKIFPENGWGIIMTALMTLALCTGAIWFCKKYFPFALGKINYLNKSSI